MYIHEKYNGGQKCAMFFNQNWKKNRNILAKQEKLNTDNIKIAHTENKLYCDLEKLINVINFTSQLTVHYRNTLFIVVLLTEQSPPRKEHGRVENASCSLAHGLS